MKHRGRDGGFILERDDGRSGADVSGHCVQDLHGVLQLQLLVQRHDARLCPAVSDQDLAQDPIVELHKSVVEGSNGITRISVCAKSPAMHSAGRKMSNCQQTL